MVRHSFLSFTVIIACFFSMLLTPYSEAKAASVGNPYFFETEPNLKFLPATLVDPLSGKGLQLAWIAAVDPLNLARLTRTYATCSSPGTPSLFGLSVGMMYCIKLYISDATHIFASGISNPNNQTFPATSIPINFFVKLYQACCFLLAIALFGVRLMTFQSESPVKDTMLLLIKIAIAFFLITQSASMFDTLAGAVGQGISVLSGVMTFSTSDPTSCFALSYAKPALVGVANATNAAIAAAVPSAPPPPIFNYGEYEPWHQIDCLFLRLFGAGPPSGTTIDIGGYTIPFSIPDAGRGSLVYASLVPVAATLLFTSSVGMSAGLLGVWVLVMFIKIVGKAMFLVLSAYLAMALFALLTPFMAPLIVFESHRNDSYMMQVFQRWMQVLFGAFIQPVVIVAYLGFAAVLLNAFVQGEQSGQPAIENIFANCKPNDPQSDGICSINQIISPVPGWTLPFTNIPNPSVGNYNYMTEINPIIAHTRIFGDAQTASSNCSLIDRAKTYMQQVEVVPLNQIDSKASGFSLTGPNRFKMHMTRIMKLALTFTCLLITGFILLHLMDTVVKLAAAISGSTVINLWNGAKVPFVNTVEAALKGAKEGMSDAKKYGTGGVAGVNAAKGAGEGIFKLLTGKRR